MQGWTSMQYIGLSDVGKVRQNNEDYILMPASDRLSSIKTKLKKYGYLFIVCDGVGGHNAGEIASKFAAQYLMHNWYGDKYPELSDHERLRAIIREVNDEILKLSREKPDYSDMATTLTALLVKGKTCFIANIGDSRTYLLANNTLTQITDDHSAVWPLYKGGFVAKDDLRFHPKKHLITRALGLNDEPQIDVFDIQSPRSGLFLLCTDGLTDLLSDESIKEILQMNADLSTKANNLLHIALDNSGKDNISMILLQL